MVTVHDAVSPSLSVTVKVRTYVPARSTKNVVLADVGDAGVDVDPGGAEVTVHR
jgi:tRNA-dihydrouridine synthase